MAVLAQDSTQGTSLKDQASILTSSSRDLSMLYSAQYGLDVPSIESAIAGLKKSGARIVLMLGDYDHFKVMFRALVKHGLWVAGYQYIGT